MMLLLVSSQMIYASTIESLFQEIHEKVKNKDFDGIKNNIYFLSRNDGSSNLDFILDGIKEPTNSNRDNGFNEKALLMVIRNSDRFFPIKYIALHQEFLKAFDDFFDKKSKLTSFYKDLRNHGRNVYVLYPTDKRTYVIVYNDGGVFKLIWWKDLVYLSEYLERK